MLLVAASAPALQAQEKGAKPAQPKATYSSPVILIPGVMGSRLKKGDAVIWGDSIWTMKSRFEELALPPDLSDDGVQPDGPITELRVVGGLVKLKQYTDILDHLRAAGLKDGVTLFVFDYDWRRSSADSARKLAEAVKGWSKKLPRPDAKFKIVAHSMGGLVAKYYINNLDGDRRVDRLITLGTPTAGSVKALMMFRGGLLDDEVNSFLGEAKVRHVLRTFPSSYELLPRYKSCCRVASAGGQPRELDLFSTQTWRQYRWIEFAPAEEADGWKLVEQRLSAAQEFHHALRGVSSKVNFHKIAGYSQRTLDYLVFDPNTGKPAEYWSSGDGTVTVESARIAEVRGGEEAKKDRISNVQRVSEKHGSIYADAIAKEAILDLIADYSAPRPDRFYGVNTEKVLPVPQADIALDRPYYAKGAAGTVTIDARDSKGQPVPQSRITVRIGEAAALAAETAAQGPLRYRFTAPASPGTYVVSVSIRQPADRDIQVTDLFEVVP